MEAEGEMARQITQRNISNMKCAQNSKGKGKLSGVRAT